MKLQLFSALFFAINVPTSIAAASSIIRRNDTPYFWLVSSSNTTSVNLLPLRPSGGADGSTLGGSSPPGQFYFDNSDVLSLATTPPSPVPQGIILAAPTSGGCSSYGTLAFVAGSSSDKCQQRGQFTLQSNNQNSQLGAFLVFDGTGGFYACGSGNDVWYLATPSSGPPGLTCTPISLYTVPVTLS